MSLDRNISRCIDARNLMRDVRLEVPDHHLIWKACVAAENACEIAWEAVERELEDEESHVAQEWARTRA